MKEILQLSVILVLGMERVLDARTSRFQHAQEARLFYKKVFTRKVLRLLYIWCT